MNIGVVIAYYGGLHPKHAETVRDIKRAGLGCVQLMGTPYPEIARAEATRQALDSECDVLVMLDPNIATTADEIKKLAYEAHAARGVALLGPNPIYLDGRPRAWDPAVSNLLAFAAVDRRVLDALAKKDEREFTNSVLDTGFSKGSRPFFSPWKKSGQLLTDGIYCPEDVAFLVRVRQAGFDIVYRRVEHEVLSSSKYSERVSSNFNGYNNYAVCIPTFGPLMQEQFRLVWELEKRGVPVIEVHNCPYIDLARSRLVDLALRKYQLSGVFFLDHDIVFNPKDILTLIESAEREQAIVAGAYCMRKSAHSIIGGFKKEPGDVVTWYEGGKLEPALYSGLGFAAIPRKIFSDMSLLPELDAGFDAPLRPYFSLDITGSFYCGEDVSFCNRVQGLSVRYLGDENWEVKSESKENKIFIDTRVRIGHQGTYTYALEDNGVVVPRIRTLKTVCVGTKGEAQLSQLSAYDLPIDLKQEALDLAQEDLWKERAGAQA